ncbi:hypothetical protein K0M31_010535 [Melipona bicolor]|uniref:Uncharacterized protein n=1 Tax=Melipona bicolor TaxID=60889 RepID=A0AA40FLP5_9HYME|nr:hypothetical protein K0M31_010535 [Melipona bicolor]
MIREKNREKMNKIAESTLVNANGRVHGGYPSTSDGDENGRNENGEQPIQTMARLVDESVPRNISDISRNGSPKWDQTNAAPISSSRRNIQKNEKDAKRRRRKERNAKQEEEEEEEEESSNPSRDFLSPRRATIHGQRSLPSILSRLSF